MINEELLMEKLMIDYLEDMLDSETLEEIYEE